MYQLMNLVISSIQSTFPSILYISSLILSTISRALFFASSLKNRLTYSEPTAKDKLKKKKKNQFIYSLSIIGVKVCTIFTTIWLCYKYKTLWLALMYWVF